MGHKYLLGELKVTAADVHDAHQFHEMEVTGEGSRFAWTKVKDVVFYLPLNRASRKRLTLTAVAIVDPDFAKRFECTVDGHPLPCKLASAPGEIRIDVDLPVSEDVGITRVVFSLPEVRSPQGDAGGEDTRLLGFAFREIEARTVGARRAGGLFS
jgi:hypothetical protein